MPSTGSYGCSFRYHTAQRSMFTVRSSILGVICSVWVEVGTMRPSRTVLVVLLLPTIAHAQGSKTADWRAQAAEHLKPAQIQMLGTQKFVVGDDTYKQAFTPYLRGDLPVFVTTDS